jgi:hypothetical protein
MEHLLGADEAEISSVVLAILRRLSDDLQGIDGLLRGAEDLEWVSDAAALFLARLDHVRRLLHTIGTRLDSADTAIRALAR